MEVEDCQDDSDREGNPRPHLRQLFVFKSKPGNNFIMRCNMSLPPVDGAVAVNLNNDVAKLWIYIALRLVNVLATIYIQYIYTYIYSFLSFKLSSSVRISLASEVD